jgi:hypothetical protein
MTLSRTIDSHLEFDLAVSGADPMGEPVRRLCRASL